jgi:hypothetical protein
MVVIVLLLHLQLPVQSVPITTNGVFESRLGEVSSVQHCEYDHDHDGPKLKKDRQYNGESKKDKKKNNDLQNDTGKHKHKKRGELRCSGRARRPCSTSNTPFVVHFQTFHISHVSTDFTDTVVVTSLIMMHKICPDIRAEPVT